MTGCEENDSQQSDTVDELTDIESNAALSSDSPFPTPTKASTKRPNLTMEQKIVFDRTSSSHRSASKIATSFGKSKYHFAFLNVLKIISNPGK